MDVLPLIEIIKKQVAQLLECDERSVTRFQNREVDPLPIAVKGKRGTHNIYCAIQVHKWKMRRQLEELGVGEDGSVYDYETERARLTHHQANKTQLEEDVLRGSLIPEDIVMRVQGDMVSSFRAKMLAIPTKAAHAVIGLEDMSEAQDTLKTFIYEALKELADYDPAQYGIESSPEHREDGVSTA